MHSSPAPAPGPGGGPLSGPAPRCAESQPKPCCSAFPSTSLLHTTARVMCQEGKTQHTSPHPPDICSGCTGDKIQFPSGGPKVHPSWSSPPPQLAPFSAREASTSGPCTGRFFQELPPHQTTSSFSRSRQDPTGPQPSLLPILVAGVLDAGGHHCSRASAHRSLGKPVC